ncbi:STAS domain-containing protein [Mesorhizobium sp. CAU 1741]|uniref:STAS domain-containing protein n=1 Tax=Mesorhizobium sp. CAU 1741 TaxID=3140366 RepID=UPI00325B430C
MIMEDGLPVAVVHSRMKFEVAPEWKTLRQQRLPDRRRQRVFVRQFGCHGGFIAIRLAGIGQTESLSAIIPICAAAPGTHRQVPNVEVAITMNIAESRQDGNLIIAPIGRIDTATSSEFDRHLGSVIDRGDTRLIIDLNGLEYISSTGLSAFLTAAKKIRAAGGRMALAGMNSRIRLVFEMSGFLRLFPVFPNVDAAIAGQP